MIILDGMRSVFYQNVAEMILHSPHENENIAYDKEPPATEQITIRTTDHERDCDRHCVDRDIKRHRCWISELGTDAYFASSDSGDRPEGDTIGQ